MNVVKLVLKKRPDPQTYHETQGSQQRQERGRMHGQIQVAWAGSVCFAPLTRVHDDVVQLQVIGQALFVEANVQVHERGARGGGYSGAAVLRNNSSGTTLVSQKCW